ncbi:MAG: helix-turn-helix domain-containing protein, partial [Burkholderiaceae bacterium]
LSARIGSVALHLWITIKTHADFDDGLAYPSLARLAELVGAAPNTIRKALATLQAEHLLRVVKEPTAKTSTRYVACERVDVRTEDGEVMCSIVVDYIPARMAERMAEIRGAVKAGRAPMPTAQVRIIPGAGFTYDAASSQFVREMPADKIVGADGKAGERARGEFAKMRAIL